jgi:6-phosphogluconolactonase (cycloisomerase 2 family)
VGDGHDLAFTSDGRWAYMAAQVAHHGVVLFSRDPSTGVLTQLPGTQGCITSDGASQDGAGTCQTYANFHEPSAVTLSPDDRYLYVTDYSGPDGIKVFSRNTTTGALTAVQCVESSTPDAGCTQVRDAGNSNTFAISPDGQHAYSAFYPSGASSGVSVFDRNASTGLLTQKAGAAGCLSDNGKDTNGAATCATGRGMIGAYGLTISPDGHTLYVGAFSAGGGMAIFHVGGDGSLSQLPGTAGCFSIDGSSSSGPNTCSVSRGTRSAYPPSIAPDGKTLYLPSEQSNDGGVAIFSLNPATGGATQLPGTAGCITQDGSSNGTPNQCTVGRTVSGGYSVAVSPDNAFVYLSANKSLAVDSFARQQGPSCSNSTVTTRYRKKVTISLHCTDPQGQPITRSITSHPRHGTLSAINQAKGTVTYTPKKSFKRSDKFTFVASDGTNASNTATATVRAAKPKLSRFHQKRKRWSRKGATRFIFTLNEAATVTFTFKRGHKRVGQLKIEGKRGKNKLRFNGRLKHKRVLGPGRFTVTIVATNAAGKSKKKTLKFTII